MRTLKCSILISIPVVLASEATRKKIRLKNKNAISIAIVY